VCARNEKVFERTPVRAIFRIITAASILAASLVGLQPASATPTWVTGISWTNLNVKTEPGVFQRYRREFDANSVLQTQSETQHNQAWVRTDRNSVTVTYTGKAANANRMVRFNLDGDQAFTYSTDNTVISPADLATLPAPLDVLTDSNGNASVTMTLTEPNPANRADDVLRAGISDGTLTIGTMVMLFEPAGYFPVIKLVGTGTGPEATCNTLHPFECNDADLTEETWNWSVFKKDWLPEYSQVYVKSYVAGSKFNLLYKVTDIWGTPIASKAITLNQDSGCRVCKFGSFVGTKPTDANGYVSFSLPNTNTVKEVAANEFVNTDTKTKEHGFVAFALLPTSNELQESIDEFWPQLVTDVNVKPAAAMITTLSRGGITVDGSGNVTVGVGPDAKTNPPLVVDESDNALTDTNVINLNITYLKNSIPIALYAPDVTVTADNGGLSGLVLPATPVANYKSASAQKNSYNFGYTYPQQIAITCTRPGTTTFTIATGVNKHFYSMDCVLPDHAASQVLAVANGRVGVPSAAATAQFKVADRFGNGVAGVSVAVSSSGNGSITGTTSFVSDSSGLVSVPVSAAAAGTQTLTATATDALANFTSATMNTTVRWGAQDASVAGAKGAAKLTLLNAKGLNVAVTEGKTKVSSFKPTKANQVQSLKLKKGVHKLTVKIGSASWNLTVTVS